MVSLNSNLEIGRVETINNFDTLSIHPWNDLAMSFKESVRSIPEVLSWKMKDVVSLVKLVFHLFFRIFKLSVPKVQSNESIRGGESGT